MKRRSRKAPKIKEEEWLERERLSVEYAQVATLAMMAAAALSHIEDIIECDECMEEKCLLDSDVADKVKAAVAVCEQIMDLNPFPEPKSEADKDAEFVNNLLTRIQEATLIDVMRQEYKKKYGCEPEGYTDEEKSE